MQITTNIKKFSFVPQRFSQFIWAAILLNLAIVVLSTYIFEKFSLIEMTISLKMYSLYLYICTGAEIDNELKANSNGISKNSQILTGITTIILILLFLKIIHLHKIDVPYVNINSAVRFFLSKLLNNSWWISLFPILYVAYMNWKLINEYNIDQKKYPQFYLNYIVCDIPVITTLIITIICSLFLYARNYIDFSQFELYISGITAAVVLLASITSKSIHRLVHS